MKVAVLGGGVIGVTTAYFLAKGGASVTVVDRQPGPALETSFANGGQISVNHATPWATPSTPLKALKWLGRSDAPLLIHPRWDPALAAWLIRFLANCTHRRLRINIERALRVALYSRAQLAELRAETDIEYDQLTTWHPAHFSQSARLRRGVAGHRVDDQPGLRAAHCQRRRVHRSRAGFGFSKRRSLSAASSAPDDESGNAHTFTLRLAELAGLGVTVPLGRLGPARLRATEGGSRRRDR